MADRDVILGGGFAVAPDELQHAASRIDAAADTAIHAVQPAGSSPADRHRRQPGWLADIDATWRDRTHGQLTALRRDALSTVREN